MDTGRKPIRASPLLEGSTLARLLRDLASGDGRVSGDAARTLRHCAAKGEDISGAFPDIRIALCSEDWMAVRNLLWALKYAREKGADISPLQPTIDKLRHSQDGVTSAMAGWFRSGPF